MVARRSIDYLKLHSPGLCFIGYHSISFKKSHSSVVDWLERRPGSNRVFLPAEFCDTTLRPNLWSVPLTRNFLTFIYLRFFPTFKDFYLTVPFSQHVVWLFFLFFFYLLRIFTVLLSLFLLLSFLYLVFLRFFISLISFISNIRCELLFLTFFPPLYSFSLFYVISLYAATSLSFHFHRFRVSFCYLLVNIYRLHAHRSIWIAYSLAAFSFRST